MNAVIDTGEKLFHETGHLTGISDFGVDWQALLEGEVALPPQGARFDISFEGALEGDRIRGKFTGVDYLVVRSDGYFELNLFVTITTDDGATIAMHETGTLIRKEDGPAELYLNMLFSTAHEKYVWLNTTPAWGRGTVDQATGEIDVTAYGA